MGMSSFLPDGMFRIVSCYFRKRLYLEVVTSGLGAVGIHLNQATGHRDIGASAQRNAREQAADR
jgi:hypothetical protein